MVYPFIDRSSSKNTLQEIVHNGNTTVIKGCMVCHFIDCSLSEKTLQAMVPNENLAAVV